MKDEFIFLDTNIIVYAVDSRSPFHHRAISLIKRAEKLRFCISPQVVAEFYSVITNPKRVESPLDPEGAVNLAEQVWTVWPFFKIFPQDSTLEVTLELVKRYQLRALEFFDAHIVATMIENDVATICTANAQDFNKFGEIRVMTP